MKSTHLLLVLSATASISHAAVITGAMTQNVSATYTTLDGLVTLKAYNSTSPAVPTTFNTNPGFIGVSFTGDPANQQNGINDTDGNPATRNDQEAIDILFTPTVGLAEIAFAWSRADGTAATDGIQISGFTSDPGVSGVLLPTAGGFRDIRWDSGSGSVFAELSGSEFNGTLRTLSFSNLSASLGATLRITANDSDQAAPQAAIASITYIPEPSSALLGGLGILGLLRRRR